MKRGRKPLGPRLVGGLEGSEEAKKRLRVILETVTGERSIEDASKELGIEESAFQKLRTRTLAEALQGLEPRPLGRPPKEKPEAASEVEVLKRENADLRLALEAAEIREEIALVFPHLRRTSKKNPGGRNPGPGWRPQPRGSPPDREGGGKA